MSAVPELVTPASKLDAAKAIGQLRGFVGAQQMRVVGDCCRGEEKQYFFDKLVELAALIESMPKVYEQDGLGEQAIVYLHYFTGGCDWFITEKDSEAEQLQAFGWANLGDDDCAELGYIDLTEITRCGAELDFNFTPRTLAAAKEKK